MSKDPTLSSDRFARRIEQSSEERRHQFAVDWKANCNEAKTLLSEMPSLKATTPELRHGSADALAESRKLLSRASEILERPWGSGEPKPKDRTSA